MDSSPKITGAGHVIRRLREFAGLSLTSLAERLDWDKGRLSKYETGQLGLSVEVIEELAHALDRRPEVLALLCLKARYPNLTGSETGELLEALISEIEKE